jgi:hypothetical protein
MNCGRFVRVNKPHVNAGAYIVAVSDSAQAIALITDKVAQPGDKVEDLGRVSDALLLAMKLEPGQFTRT